MSKRYRFQIDLEAGHGQTFDEAARSLRAFLKMALRSYGLRCTSAIETTSKETGDTTTAPPIDDK